MPVCEIDKILHQMDAAGSSLCRTGLGGMRDRIHCAPPHWPRDEGYPTTGPLVTIRRASRPGVGRQLSCARAAPNTPDCPRSYRRAIAPAS